MSKREHFEETGILPEGYRQLEYIESTGTQWIDTGVKCGKNLEIHSLKRFTRIDINNNSDGVQFWDSNNIIIRLNYHNNTAGQRIVCYYGDHNKAIEVISDIEQVTDWHSYDFKNGSQKIDNVQYAQNEITVTTNKTYYIGKVNSQSGSYLSYAQYKEYYFLESDEFVRNFIPALRLSDHKPGLYDLCGSICPLTDTPFYINAGTGEFLYN